MKDDAECWVVTGDDPASETFAQHWALLDRLLYYDWSLNNLYVWSYKTTRRVYQNVLRLGKRSLVRHNEDLVWDIDVDSVDRLVFPRELVEKCFTLSGMGPGRMALDPFAGSGVVGKVANEWGCKAVLIEGRKDA
jgi:DNA modification methylase